MSPGSTGTVRPSFRFLDQRELFNVRENKKTPLFTSGERTIAGLAILAAIVLTLSAQVVQSMVRPSLGLYDANPAAVVAIPNVIEARPVV